MNLEGMYGKLKKKKMHLISLIFGVQLAIDEKPTMPQFETGSTFFSF